MKQLFGQDSSICFTVSGCSSSIRYPFPFCLYSSASNREKTEDGFAAFSVRDNGQGISPALLPHLFDYSIRHASPPSGDGKRNMGLGLSVCSAVVKAHGGRLTAHNHPDGAEFIFCLPMPPADPAISTDLSEEETL